MSCEIKTTLNKFGIGSSFVKDQSYFVSTTENPPNSGRYESILKVLGGSPMPIVDLVSLNPKAATLNHIAITRMAISINRGDWDAKTAKEFSLDSLAEGLNEQIPETSETLDSDCCKKLLEASGINYKSSRNPSRLHKFFYVLSIAQGAIFGYKLGIDFGVLIGLLFAIVGAVALSTLVGFVAIKMFGYKP